MMEWLNQFDQMLNDFLLSLGILAPIISSILIVLEGTLAFLPLFVFITINVLTLGTIMGMVSSWILTTLGSLICFIIFRNGIAKWIYKKTKKKGKSFMTAMNKLKFSQIVLLVSIPFVPSFFVNMGAGFSKIPTKKYLYALLIGKIIVVLFWGYVGSNLIDCLRNPISLLKILIMVAIAYIVATIVNKKFNLDGRFQK